MTIRGGSFEWDGEELDYLLHPYTSTAANERAVEVPIARRFIERRAGAGLEVGNVLRHYGPGDWRVVDLYEAAPGVDNVDVFEVVERFDWVVAVSTLEHVRWDAPDRWDPRGAIDAVAHLRARLNPGGALLVSVPFGQHPYLDGAILSGGLEPDVQGSLVYEGHYWRAIPGEAVWHPARPERWARSVWVAEWHS
jgi:hypothetical protein